jgi:DNA-binding NarL/FixJ family response regulator
VPAVTPLQQPAHSLSAWQAESADVQSLEGLVLLCLESLANLAQISGQRGRAARLLDAARQLHPQSDACSSDELTAREWEVARLVTRGCSNRQIAHELIVSERTIDTHVSHILRKLCLVSRAQIAVWVVEHRRRFKVLA